MNQPTLLRLTQVLVLLTYFIQNQPESMTNRITRSKSQDNYSNTIMPFNTQQESIIHVRDKIQKVNLSNPIQSNQEQDFILDENFNIYLTLNDQIDPEDYHEQRKLDVTLDELLLNTPIQQGSQLISVETKHNTIIRLTDNEDVAYLHFDQAHQKDDKYLNQSDIQAQLIETIYTFTYFDFEQNKKLAVTKIPVQRFQDNQHNKIKEEEIKMISSDDSSSVAIYKNWKKFVPEKEHFLTPYKQYEKNEFYDESEEDEQHHLNKYLNNQQSDSAILLIVLCILTQLVGVMIFMYWLIQYLKDNFEENGTDKNKTIVVPPVEKVIYMESDQVMLSSKQEQKEYQGNSLVISSDIENKIHNNPPASLYDKEINNNYYNKQPGMITQNNNNQIQKYDKRIVDQSFKFQNNHNNKLNENEPIDKNLNSITLKKEQFDDKIQDGILCKLPDNNNTKTNINLKITENVPVEIEQINDQFQNGYNNSLKIKNNILQPFDDETKKKAINLMKFPKLVYQINKIHLERILSKPENNTQIFNSMNDEELAIINEVLADPQIVQLVNMLTLMKYQSLHLNSNFKLESYEDLLKILYNNIEMKKIMSKEIENTDGQKSDDILDSLDLELDLKCKEEPISVEEKLKLKNVSDQTSYIAIPKSLRSQTMKFEDDQQTRKNSQSPKTNSKQTNPEYFRKNNQENLNQRTEKSEIKSKFNLQRYSVLPCSKIFSHFANDKCKEAKPTPVPKITSKLQNYAFQNDESEEDESESDNNTQNNIEIDKNYKMIIEEDPISGQSSFESNKTSSRDKNNSMDKISLNQLKKTNSFTISSNKFSNQEVSNNTIQTVKSNSSNSTKNRENKVVSNTDFNYSDGEEELQENHQKILHQQSEQLPNLRVDSDSYKPQGRQTKSSRSNRLISKKFSRSMNEELNETPAEETKKSKDLASNSLMEQVDENFLIKHHTFKNQLGSGGMGCVSRFTDKLGLEQAIKRIRIAKDKDQPLAELDELNEIFILHKCSHPNIVKIHQQWFETGAQPEYFNEVDESFVMLGNAKEHISKTNHIADMGSVSLYYDSDPDSKNVLNPKPSVSKHRIGKKKELDHSYLYIKMELIDGKALWDFKEEFQKLKGADQFLLLKQILDALVYTHRVMKIGHRDVKPENIMVTWMPGEDGSAWTVKLLDFGISKFMNENPRYAKGFTGTPLWVSPEQLIQKDNFNSDMFSFGLVIFWLFARSSTITQYKRIFEMLRAANNEFSSQKSYVPQQVIDLVRLLCIDRVESWQLKEKKEWLEFKESLTAKIGN